MAQVFFFSLVTSESTPPTPPGVGGEHQGGGGRERKRVELWRGVGFLLELYREKCGLTQLEFFISLTSGVGARQAGELYDFRGGR